MDKKRMIISLGMVFLFVALLFVNENKDFSGEAILQDDFQMLSINETLPLPYNFTAIPNSEEYYELSWQLNTSLLDDEYRINVERWGPMVISGNDYPESWKRLANLSFDSTNFTDFSVSESIRKGAQYVYRVRVENEALGVETNWMEAWAEHKKQWGGDEVHSIEEYLSVFHRNGFGRCPVNEIIDPQVIGKLGGNVIVAQTNLGIIDFENTSNHYEYFNELKSEIELAKRVAKNNDVPIRFFIYTRADTISVHDEIPPGFNYSWIFRMNLSEFQAADGFSKIDFSKYQNSVVPEYYDYVWDNGEYFGYFYFGGVKILMNLNNSEYRAWAVNATKRMVDFFGVEGTLTPIKSGWMSYDAVPNSAQQSNAWCGDYLAPGANCTPYGPNEFESGIGAYLIELKEAGVDILANEAPNLGVRGLWFNQSHKDSMLGDIVSYLRPIELMRCIDPYYRPSSKINSSKEFGMSPLEIVFNETNLTSEEIANSTLVWDFGDGVTESGSNVTHIFTNAPGDPEIIYNVTLSVIQSNTVISISSQLIVLNASNVTCLDDDSDGFNFTSRFCGLNDCDDNNSDINPGVAENCGDGVDNNCNGLVDSGDSACSAGGNNRMGSNDGSSNTLSTPCVSSWECGGWSVCNSSEMTRACEDLNYCDNVIDSIVTTLNCLGVIDSQNVAQEFSFGDGQNESSDDEFSLNKGHIIFGVILLLVLVMVIYIIYVKRRRNFNRRSV